MQLRVLFVCLGNICRSPLAEGVFRHHVGAAGLASRIFIASAGTGGWHAGEPPDPRMCQTARKRGIDLSRQRARKLSRSDLDAFDLVLVMDEQNLADVRALAGSDPANVRLFREFDPEGRGEVPDPYYGGPEGFDHVFEIVDRTSRALLAQLRLEHGL